ncbi:MAG TPA: AAA family ATPase [Phycisphaerae bacterium]|nr:AAA family ATPase [Phycisphaerae bacterium]
MKIVRLEAQNVKRLKAVNITPEGHLVVIGGRNAQGKTSVLDSIASALGGKGLCPDKPVRAGTKKAKVVCDLGDLIVIRTFTESGGGTLVVKSKDGATYPSPQAMLDSLVGKMTFDPLAFLRESPKRQLETLKGLVGLDFTEADSRRAGLYEQRHTVNQDVKRLSARVNDLVAHEDVPAEEVSVNDLSANLSAAHATNQHNAEVRQRVIAAETNAKQLRDKIKEDQRILGNLEAKEAELRAQAKGVADVDVAALEQQIADLSANLVSAHATNRHNADVRQAVITAEGSTKGLRDKTHEEQRSLAALEADEAELRSQGSDLADVDIMALEQQIATAEATNRKVRDNRARSDAATELAKHEEASAILTEQINTVDADKAKAMREAAFPVDGLGFAGDGVLYNDLPFGQASSAEQLRVSVAVGLAMNPKLRVLLIRDGSLLDEENLRLIAEMAEAKDAQVWLERVGEGDECQIVIEDGMVKNAILNGGE